MAITAATTTGGFAGFLNPDQAGGIFDQARRQSVVQSLARQVPLGINGVDIPVVTQKPTAGWTAEGGQKPATEGALGIKTITPKKLTAIAVVSAEVVRANPGNYINVLRGDIAEAFAVAFDSATLHGTSTPFTTYLGQTAKTVELGAGANIHADVVAGLTALVNDGKRLTGFAFDNVVEPTFLTAADSTGRPLYLETPLEDTAPAARQGRLIGRPAFMGEGISAGTTRGFAGDWSQVVWGQVGGISFDVSTETTVTINGVLTSLWEHNLVAIRAEAEYGFLVNDTAAFVRYIDAV